MTLISQIEAELKGNFYIENVCAYANNQSNYVIALILPNRSALKNLIEELNLKNQVSFEENLENPKLVKHVLNNLQSFSLNIGLNKYEIPQKIKICKEIWTPDNGLVSAIFKVRRRQLYNFYKNDIKKLYENDKNNSKI